MIFCSIGRVVAARLYRLVNRLQSALDSLSLSLLSDHLYFRREEAEEEADACMHAYA